MDETLKRRLVGALILILTIFIVSLLLPRPGKVSTAPENQRVILDLTGNSPETIVMAPTPVPPVIAAVPAPVPNAADSSIDNATTAPEIEEPPAASPVVESAKAVEPAKIEAPAIAANPASDQKEVMKAPTKPALKLDDTLKKNPVAVAEKPKPAEKTPPKTVAKAPAPAKPKAPVKPATAPVVAAKSAAPASKSANWFVQVGAYTDIANAHKAKDALKAKGLPGIISPMDSDKGTRYRVRLGPFASQDKATKAKDRAAQTGYPGGKVFSE